MTKKQKEQFVNYINQIYSYQQNLEMKASRNNVISLNAMFQGFEAVVKLINSCETIETIEVPKSVKNDENNAIK